MYTVLLFVERVRGRVARLHDEGAQGLVEYVFIISLVAVVAIVAMVFFAGRVTTYYSNIANSIT